MTKEIVLSLEPRPGTLVEVLALLAKERVNIRGAFGANVGASDTWHMVVDEEARALNVLRAAGKRFETHDVAVATVDDKPGALHAACEKIASRGINIEAIYNLTARTPGHAEVAFRVPDARAAEAALRAA